MDTETPSAEALLSEELIPVQELPARLPPAKSGRRVHRAAVWRWVSQGLRGPDGTRVQLEALRMGRRWVTSKQAVARFFIRLSDQRVRNDAAPARGPATAHSSPATVATLARFGLRLPNAAGPQ